MLHALETNISPREGLKTLDDRHEFLQLYIVSIDRDTAFLRLVFEGLKTIQ